MIGLDNNYDVFSGLELFYNSTGCYVSVYDKESKDFVWSCSEEFNVFFREAIDRPYVIFNDSPTTFFINSFELVGGFNYSKDGKTYTVVVGPAFVTDPFSDLRIIGKTLYFVTGGDTQKLKNYLYVSKITDKKGFNADLLMCYYLLTGKKISKSVEESTVVVDINKDIIQKLFDMREEEKKDYFSFERQELLLSAISSGNLENTKKLCTSFLNFSAFKRCEDNLMSSKFRFIAAMLLVNRQAVIFGVDETKAAAIYKEFCRKVYASEREWEINEIFLKVTLEYAKSISESQIYKVNIHDVNPVVIKAVNYISQHLHKDLTVAEICCYCGVSESYLRVRFKHDIGKSIVEYVTEQKIEEAKMLLKYTNYSLLEISEYLSFSSQSYFTTVFRKNCGQTPTEYRNLLKNSRNSK